jgi:hypothetical protein
VKIAVSTALGTERSLFKREHIEVGAIQDIEEFAAKLHFDPVVEFPDLCDREIPFAETGPAKNVASRIAELSRRPSPKYSVAGNVASTGGAGKTREIGEVRISIE